MHDTDVARPARSRTRLLMLMLLSIAVLINYLDRSVLGIAAPSLQHEFALGPQAMGVVFSAFSWTYFLAQVPAGILLDRLGNRRIYGAALASWSCFTLLHAAATGLMSLIGLRCGLGLSEAPCFPANSNVVGLWFPRSERARAIGIYTAAEYVGLGFLTPLLFWMLAQFGWRALFLATGGIGAAFSLVWFKFYREPYESHRTSTAELDLIQRGGGMVARNDGGIPFRWQYLQDLFRYRQMWGLCIGQFAVYSTFVFFLTWFPTYLATARHMAWIKVGIYTALPYICGFIGILFAGWWSDMMLQRSVSLVIARKLPVIAGLGLATCIILANYVRNDAVVIGVMSVSFFAQAMSSSGWSVVSEVSPAGALGIVGGFFNASAALSGIVTPLVIGVIVQRTGSFNDALLFVGVVALAGAFSWIFIVGDLRRMQLSGRVPPKDGMQST